MGDSKKSLSITAKSKGQRLDLYLASELGYSRSFIQKNIQQGNILVNHSKPKAHYILREHDKIEMAVLQKKDKELLENTPFPLDFLYEDDDIIVINKPAFISVHPGAGSEKVTVAGALHHYTSRLASLPDSSRPGIVHRLDKNTTGCLVIARTDEAYMHLKKQFQEKSVDKTYVAILHGECKRKYMKIDTPIRRHPKMRKKMAVSKKGIGRTAITEVTLKNTASGFSLVQVKILTGRTHQIRVHLSNIGYPVLGDKIYGRNKRMPSGILKPERQMLHAWKLGIIHPSNCNNMLHEAPWPKDFIDIWNSITDL